MIKKTISYKNTNQSYRTAGEGKTVVLIHGFAEDGEVWNNQVDFLKDHFRLIIPDLPGSGQSELVPGANIETYAEVIKLILDTELQQISLPPVDEQIKPISTQYAKNSIWGAGGLSIIGHSMGGYITLAFAEKYPQYLISFGLFHSSAFADNEEKKQARTKAISFINDNGTNAFLKTSIPGLFTKAYAAANPEKIAELIERGKSFSPAALVQYHHAMIARPDRTEVLKTFSKPILFIIGEQDTAVPLQSSLRQCYLPAQSDVHILENAAHMGMWEEKEKANSILFIFLINKF